MRTMSAKRLMKKMPVPAPLLSLLTLSLLLFSGVGSAWGTPHALVLGLSIDVPVGWEVPVAVEPGAKVRLDKERKMIFAAISPKKPVLIMFSIRVSSGGAEAAKAIQGGKEKVTAYHRKNTEALKGFYKKLTSVVQQTGAAEPSILNGHPCIKGIHSIKDDAGYTHTVSRILIPVGNTLYELIAMYLPADEKEAVEMLAPIFSSVTIEYP